MKKFLSLVLALAMAMSLVTISAGAKDFTDDSKIAYKEAVDVVSALDIVDGYTDGSFNPSNTLTRGAAAKIICNLILGPTTADALSADTAPFKDVPVTNEFAGYITYCSQQGIISGYGDGTFRPAGTLTGYAFMKMLLGALGYDAEIEGYEGANWSVAVAKQAVGIGLDDGNDNFVGVKAVTREEACLYAFNTLTADMVEYGSTTTVNVNGATVVVGGSKASVMANRNDDYRTAVSEQDSDMQFCEKYFPKLELRNSGSDNTDVFGRPCNTWYNDKTKIGSYAKEADLVYTADVKSKDLYADLDIDVAYEFEVVIDGDPASYNFFAVKRDNQNSTGANASSKINAVVTGGSSDPADALVGNGSLIEVYKDEHIITVVNTYLMQVAGAYDEDEEELTLAPVDGTRPIGVSYEDVLSSDDFDNLDAYEDEDYVLVTVADGAIRSIAKAEMTTAAVTEYVDDESVTAGGTEYDYAYGNATTDPDYVLKAEYDLYLDAYGNVIYVADAETAGNYVFISDFAGASNMSNAKIEAYAYFADGTDGVITLDKVNGVKVNKTNLVGGTPATGVDVNKDGTQDVAVNLWFKYSEKDGTYSLTGISSGSNTYYNAFGNSVDVLEDGSVDIKTGAATTVKGNSATVFVILKDNGNVKAYTGIKNAPEAYTVATGSSSMAIGVYAESGYAKYVFLMEGNGVVKGGATSSDLIYLVAAKKYGTDADGNDYYRYDAIKNGVKGESAFIEGNVDTLKGLYTEIEYDGEYITSYEEVNSTYASNNSDDFTYLGSDTYTVSYKSSTLTLSAGGTETGFYLATGAKIFVIDGDNEVTTVAASSMPTKYKTGLAADSVVGAMNADGEYTSIYIKL